MNKLLLVVLMALVLSACARDTSLKSPGKVSAAAELEAKTVALVLTDDEDGTTRAYCSGVWVSSNEILTAAHCVESNPLAKMLGLENDPRYVVKGDVFADGTEVRYPISRRAMVARTDEAHDLALLRVLDAPSHGVAAVASGDILQGSFAQTMGQPKGLWWSYSSGDVAAIRFAPLGGEPMWWIQSTAPISPGNSGCGLFDADGRLIGIMSRVMSGRAQGLNFFVHRDHITAFLGGAS